MTKYAVLFSSMAVLTLSLGERATAMVSLPNVGRCFSQASTKADFQRCEALKSCVEDQSDDQASLQGCMALAEDAYVVRQEMVMGSPPTRGGRGAEIVFAANTSPVLGLGQVFDMDDVEVMPSNSELVWGIQGDKGFTNQQQGPND